MQIPGALTGVHSSFLPTNSPISDRGAVREHALPSGEHRSIDQGAPASSNRISLEHKSVLPSSGGQHSNNDVHLSDEAKRLSLNGSSAIKGKEGIARDNSLVTDEATKSTQSSIWGEAQVSDREKLELTAEIEQLSQRDREVRNHERIHASVAGAHGGAPRFQFQRGPDGVLYAVSGSVSIDLSVVPGNAEATLRKAEQIERAALAPSDPSGADRAVAVKARSLANQTRIEITEQTREEQSSGSEDSGDGKKVDADPNLHSAGGEASFEHLP